MERLPEELIAKIFSYCVDPVTASQVCSYFKLVATTQIRSINIKLSSEKSHQIRILQESLDEFQALRNLKLELSFDVNNVEKAKFVQKFSGKITSLILREMTFLNPYFDLHDSLFCNLTSLTIHSSDVSSSSNEIAHFILNCCPKLVSLSFCGCSGLDIEALDRIGQNLNRTKIENLTLQPTYSYFDLSQEAQTSQHWTIENLRVLSIRSTLVVMKKNFVKHVIGSRSEKLNTLELISNLDLGERLVSRIIHNYPNLEKLSLGKNCSIVGNEDFSNICNFYKKLRSLEFHFSQSDEDLDLRTLEKNDSITELTLGLTKNISRDALTAISRRLGNVKKLSIVLYFISKSNQDFLTFITAIFPKVVLLEFQRTGMSENLKFTAIKDHTTAIDSSQHFRHFDEIRNLLN